IRQPPQAGDGVVGTERATLHVVEKLSQGGLVHGVTYPARTMSASASRVAYLGPPGTFTEEALLTQPDLAGADLVDMHPMTAVLDAVESSQVDLGFVPIENSIEGTVNLTLDSLIFEHDLVIQREVTLPVQMNLLAPPGMELGDVRRVVSIPHALAQCRRFFAEKLSDVEEVPANSTAEAVQLVAESKEPGTAA